MSATTAHAVITPAPRRVLGRALVFVGIGLFLLAIVLISIGAGRQAVAGIPFSATNAAPEGSMAIAEVLRQQGVKVTAAASLTEAASAVKDRSRSTLLIYDPKGFLSDLQLQQATRLARHVVILDPGFTELRAVAPAVAQAGEVSGSLSADCDVPAVQKAGSVSGGGSGFRILNASTTATGCLATGDRVFSLVQLDDGALTILGTTDALTNQYVADKGNAALALNLLGQDPNLVWYLPGYADLPTGGDISALTPRWVVPIALLLAVIFIASAVWHGRRMGPLVIENLPVTVRASETMLGRARLYENSSSRLRALDSLRIGSIGRLAVLCGLPRVATVDEVVTSVSKLVGAQPLEVRRLLVDDIPGTDRKLIRLSDDLLLLERQVTTALRS